MPYSRSPHLHPQCQATQIPGCEKSASGTNAISSIIVIGALIQVSSEVPVIKWIAVATLLITSINIAGGFAVTRRMLDMFRK